METPEYIQAQRIVGGNLALDFLNTQNGPAGGPPEDDVLRDYEDLLAWAQRVGALTEVETERLARQARRAPGPAGSGARCCCGSTTTGTPTVRTGNIRAAGLTMPPTTIPTTTTTTTTTGWTTPPTTTTTCAPPTSTSSPMRSRPCARSWRSRAAGSSAGRGWTDDGDRGLARHRALVVGAPARRERRPPRRRAFRRPDHGNPHGGGGNRSARSRGRPARVASRAAAPRRDRRSSSRSPGPRRSTRPRSGGSSTSRTSRSRSTASNRAGTEAAASKPRRGHRPARTGVEMGHTTFRDGLLRGKSAFVTGGSSGINLGIAQAFARAGAKVADQRPEPGQARRAVAELRRTGPREGFAADVRDYAAMEQRSSGAARPSARSTCSSAARRATSRPRRWG